MTDLMRQVANEKTPGTVECPCCKGTGRMVRDPDIGTDQECFCCNGSGQDQFDHSTQQLDEIDNLGHDEILLVAEKAYKDLKLAIKEAPWSERHKECFARFSCYRQECQRRDIKTLTIH